jgi:hypothetical protein
VSFVIQRENPNYGAHKEKTMQFVLLIYQGTTATSAGEVWKTYSEEERKQFAAEYAAINNSPGVAPGLPLGLPKDATTVRVENGKMVTTNGPFVGVRGAVGGYYVLEAGDLDLAIKMAARVPAARLGGAIEVRPVGKYW